MAAFFDRLVHWISGNQDTVVIETPPEASAATPPDPVDDRCPLPGPELTREINNQFYANLFMVEATPWQQPTRSQIAEIRQVVRKLQDDSYRQKAVPRLPVVMPQLLRSLRNPSTSATDFVKLIRQDPVIASGILKMVNSVFYNPGNKAIDSFHRAVVILGLQGMRYALSNAVMHPIIEGQSNDYPQFGNSMWDHAISCASACQILAKRQRQDPFTAYLTGLVHDMGAVTLFSQYTQQFRSREQAPVNCLVYLISVYGQQLSVDIAKDWKFPDEVVAALAEQTSIRDTRKRSLLGEILFTANHLCETHLLANAGEFSKEKAQEILEQTDGPRDLFVQLDKMSANAA